MLTCEHIHIRTYVRSRKDLWTIQHPTSYNWNLKLRHIIFPKKAFYVTFQIKPTQTDFGLDDRCCISGVLQERFHCTLPVMNMTARTPWSYHTKINIFPKVFIQAFNQHQHLLYTRFFDNTAYRGIASITHFITTYEYIHGRYRYWYADSMCMHSPFGFCVTI